MNFCEIHPRRCFALARCSALPWNGFAADYKPGGAAVLNPEHVAALGKHLVEQRRNVRADLAPVQP